MLKKLTKSAMRMLLFAAFGKSLPPLTEAETRLIEELRLTFASFPVLDTTNCPPSEQAWFSYMNRLRELMLKRDPRQFLSWDIIAKTMFVEYADYVQTELDHLRNRGDWAERWRKAIDEVAIGCPLPYWRYPRSSGNLIHHAYHIAQFEEKTHLPINAIDNIFEFGGGYGSMCRLVHNLGFKGKYIIFDLPAFSSLQQFFLKSIGVPVHPARTFDRADRGVLCISDLSQLKETLVRDIPTSKTLFIATWSISETPLHLREAILPLTTGFKAYLIAYQDEFQEVNNIDFFKQWKNGQSNIRWCDWKIDHLPHSNYLVGIREELPAPAM